MLARGSAVEQPPSLPEAATQHQAMTPEGVALAHLYGEPLFALPRDLYIPPDALEVFLETFQGPLDLLLYLIRRQNFNVLDIPMAEVTRQYLSYVDQIRDQNLELAGEYLLMAALLMEIKSRMLLPVKKLESDGEPDDPRAELVRRLLEYEQIKLAAQKLDAMPQLGRDFQCAHALAGSDVAPVLPQVDADDLRRAWADIMQRARVNTAHRVAAEQLSVREHMSLILRRLGSVRFMEFTDLFMERVREGELVAVVVVHFLALLELARESLLEITQAAPYAPIYVRLSYTRSDA
jgi:segregation and condensation protein A